MDFSELERFGNRSYKPKSEDAVYDFGNVSNDAQFIRLVACVNLLYLKARELSGAPREVLQGVRQRRQRHVRFFDTQEAAVSGTGAEPVTYIAPGGTAGWKWVNGSKNNPRFNDPAIPVSERDDERIYVKPQSPVLNFGPYVAIIWHEMTHIFTMLTHGRWTARGGFEQPAAPENIAWHAFMHRLEAAAPSTAIDPITGELDFVAGQATDWACSCGSTLPG